MTISIIKAIFSVIGIFVGVAGITIVAALCLSALAILVFCMFVGALLVIGVASMWDMFDNASLYIRNRRDDHSGTE